MAMDYSKLENFKCWFEEEFRRVRCKKNLSGLFDELELRLTDLGAEDWEVGYLSQDRTDFFIVIREIPDRYIEKLYPDTEVHGNKSATIRNLMPKIDWDRIVARYPGPNKVDASSWMIRIIGSSDNAITLEVYARNLEFLSSEEVENVIHTVLIREIGEANYNKISAFNLVPQMEINQFIPIQKLYSETR